MKKVTKTFDFLLVVEIYTEFEIKTTQYYDPSGRNADESRYRKKNTLWGKYVTFKDMDEARKYSDFISKEEFERLRKEALKLLKPEDVLDKNVSGTYFRDFEFKAQVEMNMPE